MSRVFVRRRFHQKTLIVCPSVFLCCFISVCLGFPLCVVFFVFFLFFVPGNSSWLSFCVKGQGRVGAHMAKIKFRVKPDIFKSAQFRGCVSPEAMGGAVPEVQRRSVGRVD